MLTREEFAEELLRRDRFLLITHRRPDGDTAGSASALCLALRQLGKTAFLFQNPDITPLNAVYTEGLWAEADYTPACTVSVDVASATMLPAGAPAQIDLAVDHHGSHTCFARDICLDPDAAACGEIVYDIILSLGAEVTPAIALRLYAAIATDTGCFLYSNVTPDTHRIAADLLEVGIDFRFVNKRHFETKSLVRLKIEGILAETAEFFGDGHTVIMSVPLSLMQSLGATEEDLENIASFPMLLEEVRCGILLKQTNEQQWKVSVRTDESVNASDLCAHFGGGGHRAAAGCSIHGTQKEVKTQLLHALHEVTHG